MVVTMKSKAAGNVIMLGDLAHRLFDIMGRELSPQGIFTVEQLPDAISKLEAAVSVDQVGNEPAPHESPDDANEKAERVRLGARAFPLLEHLRAARKQGEVVIWES